MPGPNALRRIALGSLTGAGLGLLGLAFHGMAGLDTRLATIAQARDAQRTQMVVERRENQGPGASFSPCQDDRDH